MWACVVSPRLVLPLSHVHFISPGVGSTVDFSPLIRCDSSLRGSSSSVWCCLGVGVGQRYSRSRKMDKKACNCSWTRARSSNPSVPERTTAFRGRKTHQAGRASSVCSPDLDFVPCPCHCRLWQRRGQGSRQQEAAPSTHLRVQLCLFHLDRELLEDRQSVPRRGAKGIVKCYPESNLSSAK